MTSTPTQPPAGTPEQEARDLLEQMGIEDAQSWSAGELVFLANRLHELSICKGQLAAAIRERDELKQGLVVQIDQTLALSRRLEECRAALVDAVEIIGGLADQQAISDDWYKLRLERLRALSEQPGG